MASSKFYGRNHVKISSKIKAIFFDLDNTLIQTRKSDVKACEKVMNERNWGQWMVLKPVIKWNLNLCKNYVTCERKQLSWKN